MLADGILISLNLLFQKCKIQEFYDILIENTNDETIKKYAQEKLKFTPLTEQEKAMYQGIVNYKQIPGSGGFSEKIIKDAEEKLSTGGTLQCS